MVYHPSTDFPPEVIRMLPAHHLQPRIFYKMFLTSMCIWLHHCHWNVAILYRWTHFTDARIFDICISCAWATHLTEFSNVIFHMWQCNQNDHYSHI